MSDLAERQAERQGDLRSLWRLRYRRGLCPQCGEGTAQPTVFYRHTCFCCFTCFDKLLGEGGYWNGCPFCKGLKGLWEA